MKILIVGAGAVGAVFGANLHQHKADVSFLLRPARKELLDEHGLTVCLPSSEFHFQPRSFVASTLQAPFDLIILSNKAYALDGVINDIKPAVGPNTLVLPLLNGLRHLDVLDEASGKERVLGGVARTIATLETPTRVVVSNFRSTITVGARTTEQQTRAEALWQLLADADSEAHLAGNIMADMWDKFCRMAAVGAVNCLLDGPIGAYMRSEAGGEIALQLFHECCACAEEAGFPMSPQAIAGFERILTDPSSSFTSSMYRDLKAGLPIEGDHLVGDMLQRAKAAGLVHTMLRVAYARLQTYNAQLLAQS